MINIENRKESSVRSAWDFPSRPDKDYKVSWKETQAELTKLKRPQNSEYFSPQCNYSVSTQTN
jgi:hypothetical protein